MKNIVHFEPLTPELYDLYIKVGTEAYNQHYVHLWPQQNTTPYIESSFTKSVLEDEAKNGNTLLYIIRWNKQSVGIFKMTLDAALNSYTAGEALYIDKIYILNEFSGKGIGKKVLHFAMLRAKELNKKIIWLDTMQKGPALNFYLKNGYSVEGKSQVTLPTVLESEKQMWIMVKKC